MSQLLQVAEAQQKLLSSFSPLGLERVPLAQAAGRVLAEPIQAQVDLPPFPNSSMDGFGLQSEDTRGASREAPIQLTVISDIPAGTYSTKEIGPGQAARIMTGAPLPPGVDAVIPVEDTDVSYRQPGAPLPSSIRIYRPVATGDNIRPLGQDVYQGETVLQPGRWLRPQDLGFLAMLGVSQVPVRRRPRVAVFSTGDELLMVDQPLEPGKIHDANSTVLLALIDDCGGSGLHFGIIPDREEAVWACLEKAVASHVDLILSSAGVSVGAFDFVRSVVEKEGHLEFWRVNMRPGKPLAFGDYQGIPFVGLPGNPVSAFVGFEVFVRPAIALLLGLAAPDRTAIQVRLAEPIESDGRESYLRAVIERQSRGLTARLTGHQGSGNLRSLVEANALLLVPSGVKSLPAGAELEAWLLGSIL